MISFNEGSSKFNFRVGGLFIDEKNKRFLTNTLNTVDFYIMPGGRVEMGESSIEALKREMIEELGVKISVVSLKAVAENFFNFNGYDYHEIQFLYIAKLDEEKIQNINGKFLGNEKKDLFQWFSFDELETLNYKPIILKPVIKEALNGDFTFRHIVFKGNG